MSGKKVLVAMGAGFIGSAIVDRLVESGYKVRVVDTLSSGRKENSAAHTGKDYFEFIEESMLDKDVAEKSGLSELKDYLELRKV